MENNAYTYVSYGLGIRSELCLPELPIESKSPDVEIKRERPNVPVQSSEMENECFWANDNEVYRFYKNVGSFLIRHGREILIKSVPGVDERILRGFLLGNIFGFLLHQRGMLVLHGSAIAMDEKAIVFLGPSGSGKSTAAASLTSRGCSLVADDLVAINSNGDVPLVYPAFPQLKLCQDAANSLGHDPKSLLYISPIDKSKRAIRITSGFSADPLPLGQIYLLEYGNSIKKVKLNQKEAMIELVRNSKAIELLNVGANLIPHFSQCSKVAKIIPVCQLARPSNLDSLSDFAMFVENDI